MIGAICADLNVEVFRDVERGELDRGVPDEVSGEECLAYARHAVKAHECVARARDELAFLPESVLGERHEPLGFGHRRRHERRNLVLGDVGRAEDLREDLRIRLAVHHHRVAVHRAARGGGRRLGERVGAHAAASDQRAVDVPQQQTSDELRALRRGLHVRDCIVHMSRRDELRALLTSAHQYVLAAAIVGAVTGFAVVGFERITINVVFDRVVADLPLAVLAVVPGIGLAMAALWLRGPGHGLSPSTSDEYLDGFHTDHPLTIRALAHRMVAAVATLGSGCALGLEGPSIYIGASIGNAAQRRFKRYLFGADRNLLLVAGAAAGISAIFKAPATGAIFAIEVPYQDDLARRMLLPALVAGASGYLALVAVNGTAPLFPVSGVPPLSFVDLMGAALLGVAGGLGARTFAWMLRAAKRASGRAHIAARVVLAGAAIAVLFVLGRGLTGQNLVLTPGYGVVLWALDPRRSVGILLALLVLRCCATSAAVAGGGAGGLFVPLVVAGALLGRAFGVVIGHDSSLFLVVGIAAFLGAGYRVPLAAIMFVAETTGRPGFVVPGVIAAVVAELMMGNSSVTTHQRGVRAGGSEPGSGEIRPDAA